MTKSKKQELIPELRFPDFKNEGNWTIKRLADFDNLPSGDGDWILSKDMSSNGSYKIVQLASIGFGSFKEKNLKTISEETFLELNGTPIEKGDLLINRMVDANKINCCIFPLEGKYITSVDVCWIRQNNSINNYFLMSLLSTGDSQIKLLSLSSGAGRVRISKSNLFENFFFPLPKNQKEEQKIASCLSILDEVITAHSQKLNLLKEHKKGLMQNLFPQEGEKVPKMRFKEFEKDGEWVQKKLGQIGEPLMCKRVFKEQTSENPNNGVPFYKIGTFGKVADSYIPIELFKEYKSKYSFPKVGDILISASGTIGRLVVYDGAPAFFQDSNIIWLGNDEKNILNSFLFCCYSTMKWQTSDGGIISRLYNSDFKNMQVRFPKNKTEQEKIAACLAALDTLLTAQKDKIEQLMQHKKGLMQSLFPKMSD